MSSLAESADSVGATPQTARRRSARGDALLSSGHGPGYLSGRPEGRNGGCVAKQQRKLERSVDPKSKIREVHTATFGYTMTNVRIVAKPGGEAYKLSAFVLALPRDGGTWPLWPARTMARYSRSA